MAVAIRALGVGLTLLTAASCSSDSDGSGRLADVPALRCEPGAPSACSCPDGSSRMTQCAASGTATAPCPCNGPAPGAMAGASGQAPGTPAEMQPTTMQPMGMQPMGMQPMGMQPMPMQPMPMAGSASPEPMEPEPMEPEPEPETPANPDDPFDALRQACVDHINMYRATVGLEPYRRATPEQEACSDRGAEQDATSGRAHGSAGSCQGLGAQNTCPGYPARGGDVEPSMINCLDQMWAEGEPPIPRNECIRDYEGCFLPHGHYINMSDTRSQVVSCGFFEMPNGRWWMNQDFGR